MNASKNYGFLFLDGKSISRDIEICDAGFEECTPGHNYGPTVRNYYLFHLVLSGKGRFSVCGKDYEIGKNKAFFIRPDTLHQYCADKTQPWHYVWLGFKGAGAKALSDRALGSEEVVFDVDADLAYDLESILKTNTDTTETLFKLTSFLYRLLGDIYTSLSRSETAKPDIVKSAVRFIENNYFRPFDVTWLAGELGMSRSHFTTVFTAAMNCSPYNYLTRYRIGKAEKLLLDTHGFTVTEVAYAVGFSSIERFSEMFKKYTGVPPLAYRKSKEAKEISSATDIE